MRKKQTGDCNVSKFTLFLFGMSPDVPPVKVFVLTSDLVMLVEWVLVIDILKAS